MKWSLAGLPHRECLVEPGVSLAQVPTSGRLSVVGTSIVCMLPLLPPQLTEALSKILHPFLQTSSDIETERSVLPN